MSFLKMLLKRLLLLVVFYQLLRIVFLAFNYQFFFPLTFTGFVQILVGGFRFDMSTIAYFNTLYILMFILPFSFRYNKWYQKIGKVIFIAANSIVIVANLIDSAYFPFILHRTNAAFFLEFKNDTHLITESGKFILSYWYVAVIAVLFLWAFWKSYNLVPMPKVGEKKSRILLSIAIVPVVSLLWLGFARGSFIPSDRPINISYAGNYVNKPIETQLVINTVFSIYSTFGNIKVPDVKYFETLKETEPYFNPVQCSTAQVSFTKKNVVIIIVESLSREFIGTLNKDIPDHKGYTPFLDSLISRSLVFTNAYANGRRSIEALPSVIASIPSPTEAYVLTPYSTNEINSIGTVLKKYGYSTSFFHGAHNGSMGFNSFARLAGFERTFGLEDYDNSSDYDGTWGIYDEEFLQCWAKNLNATIQPFCSALFTVSSHHPFKIPDKYIGKFEAGTLPIHQSIRYTDYSLQKFFETASKMSWYKNTVFVITADHTATYPYYEEYNNTRGAFSVPIIFFTPDSSLRGSKDVLAQQSDIFPTLVSYLGIKDSILAFGSNLLTDGQDKFLVNCFAGTYQALEGDYLLQFDGNKSISLFNIKQDVKIRYDILAENEEVAKRIELRLKAYIQQYATRVRNNKMLP
jgi:phosphoglycerol transferase MdoB-like AlkP superfamily enzyme